jgi:hypothetical protein
MRTRSQEKGYREELIAFCESILGSLDRRALWDEAVPSDLLRVQCETPPSGAGTAQIFAKDVETMSKFCERVNNGSDNPNNI